MNLLINSENLYLPEQTKERIFDCLSKLEEVSPEGSNVRLFLKHDSKNDLRAVITVRDRHNNFAYSTHGPCLLAIVRSARAHILKRLRDRKQRRLHFRKRRTVERVVA